MNKPAEEERANELNAPVASVESLEGVAIAIYENKDGHHLLSSSILTSTGPHETFLDSTIKIYFNPKDTESSRRALQRMLDDVLKCRRKIVDLDKGRQMIIPPIVVYGFAESHDEDLYTKMLRAAFPDYFQRTTHGKEENAGIAQVIEKHHHFHTPTSEAKSEEFSPGILTVPYTLFPHIKLPENNGDQAKRDVAKKFLAHTIALAKTGDTNAINFLKEMAKTAASEAAEGYRTRGILAATRFIQFGRHTSEFQDDPRYSYLDTDITGGDPAELSLLDIYIREIITHFGEERDMHHVSMRTPALKPFPAFSDILATYFADAWGTINYYRTGKKADFRNVLTKRRSGSTLPE
jgi:hypothetical protein